jgi:hypothetical protein
MSRAIGGPEGVTDTFVLGPTDVDTITDYTNVVGNADIIDVSEYVSVAGGTNVITGQYIRVTTTGLVQIDADGGGTWVTVANVNTGPASYNIQYYSGGVLTTVNVTPSGPPVALDMDGDGQISFLAADAGAHFDYGYGSVATAWVGGNDGILVRDVNHDGQASANEIVFATGGSDLQGLAAYDSNHDGQLSSADAGFADFAVWQDADSDGVVDAGEMRGLTALGISSISLASDGIGYAAAGGDVQVVGTGSYTRADGSTGMLADAVFATGSLAAAQEQQSKASAAANTLILAAAAAAAGLAASAPAAAAASQGDFAPSDHGLESQPLGGGLELGPVAASAVAKLQVAEQLALSSDHAADAVGDAFRSSADAQPFHAQLDNAAGHGGVEALLASTAMPTVHDSIVSATPFAAPSIAVPSAEQLGALTAAAAHDGGAQHNQVVGQVLAEALHGGGEGAADIDALLSTLPGHAETLHLPLAGAGAHADALTFAAGLMHDAALDHTGLAIGLIHPDVIPPT